MVRRAVVVAIALLAVVPASAGAATELNVIPHGQQQAGVAWAGAPGMLPATAQALMYDRLTPLGRNVTDAVLQPSADGTGYFKSARLLPADDPSLITDETVTAGALSARIRRDAYGVPHIYSAADDGVIFGAGYATAADRSLLLDQARNNGIAGAIDVPGAPAITLVLGLFDYQPTAAIRRQVTRQQDRALLAAGPDGRRVLRDIDTYLQGINLWYAQNRPDAEPFERADIYALNAIKAQFLGEGGGTEVQNALFLDAARDRLGKRARHAGLRGPPPAQRSRDLDDDREGRAAPDGRERRAAEGPRAAREGHLQVGRASSCRAATHSAAAPQRAKASNVLLVDGERSATGTPIMVGGPQIGYNYPGLTMEMGLYGPTIRARGATSAPFPGYMLIGRGEQFAWTLTSAGGDIVDTYAERLCGGSRTKYRYKGKCRRMELVEGGHDQQGRRLRQGALPAHGARPGRRLRPRGRHAARGRAVAPPVQRRPRDDRPDLLPAADVRPREERERLHRRRGGDAADVQLVLRGREGHRVRHHRPAAPAGEGRQRRPAGRRPRPLRVARLPRRRASTRRTSTRRAGCSSTGTTSRRRTSRPATTAGTRAARSASTGSWRSWPARTSTRRPPCSARPTRAPRPTRAG